MKFYRGHHSQKYRLQNGGFRFDIGVLLLGGVTYTFLDPTKFYFMHFSLLLASEPYFFRLCLSFYSNYAMFLLIYHIFNYLVMGHIFL